MSGIKAKNSKPELMIRRVLFAAGFRFRLHRRDLPGSPDIVMPGRQIAIFVHGCSWHLLDGCRYSTLPSTRPDFWKTKLEGNAQRDRLSAEKLRQMGWRVLWVWECATRQAEPVESLQDNLTDWILGTQIFGELSGSKSG